jgi:hypothetical protein
MIWTVNVKHPDEHVEWRMCAIVGGDTAFHHEGDDSWFMPTPSKQENKQSSPRQKVPWYTREFFQYVRDSIWVDHPERKEAVWIPQHRIAQYLKEHGMSVPAANQAEETFWKYYRDRPIITFKFPQYPAGGDQRSFAYHPTIRWFLPVPFH